MTFFASAGSNELCMCKPANRVVVTGMRPPNASRNYGVSDLKGAIYVRATILVIYVLHTSTSEGLTSNMQKENTCPSPLLY